jgi:hypothetical protein
LTGLHFPTTELDRLSSQYAELQRQLDKRKAVLGDKHPELLALEDQLKSVQKAIRTQWLRVADIANSKYRLALAHKAAAQSPETQTVESGPDTASIGLAKLQSDADRARNDYEHALHLQTKLEASAQSQTIWTVVPAQVPLSATHRPHGFIAGAAMILGAMFGAGRTLAEERRGSRQRPSPSKEMPRGMVSLPRIRRDWFSEKLGLVPPLDAACREALDRPLSDFSQAVEQLFELAAEANSHGTQKILCISEKDNLGATTLAVNLAHIAAKAGHHVLLIEANQRRPVLASLVSRNVRVNLIEVSGVERIVCQLRPGLSVIPLFDEETSMFFEARAQRCMKGISRNFDFVIVDGGRFIRDEEMMEMAEAVNQVFHLTSQGVEMKQASDFISGALRPTHSRSSRPINKAVLKARHFS